MLTHNLSNEELLQVEGGYFGSGSIANVLYLLRHLGEILL